MWQEDANGNKVPYLQNPRNPTNPITPLTIPGATSAAGNPYVAGGKMTTDEGKTALYADRAATAHHAITNAENLNQQPGGTVGALIEQNLPAGAANVLVSGERGRAMDAQRAFVNALLRRESGAAISAGEFNSYSKEYFPQLGDTPAQIEAKRQHRAEVIAGWRAKAARATGRPIHSTKKATSLSGPLLIPAQAHPPPPRPRRHPQPLAACRRHLPASRSSSEIAHADRNQRQGRHRLP